MADRRPPLPPYVPCRSWALTAVCARYVTFLPSPGSASVLVTGTLPSGRAVAAACPRAAALEDAQFVLDEGPGVQAAWEGRPVVVADLAASGGAVRWPAFTPLALRLNVRAVLAVPLCAGNAVLGALTAWLSEPGSPPEPVLRAAAAMAESATGLLLRDPPAGSPLADLVTGGRARMGSGTITTHLGVTAEQALARLREYAQERRVALRAVAEYIIEHRRSRGWARPGAAPPAILSSAPAGDVAVDTMLEPRAYAARARARANQQAESARSAINRASAAYEYAEKAAARAFAIRWARPRLAVGAVTSRAPARDRRRRPLPGPVPR